jgi:hypothetical protein
MIADTVRRVSRDADGWIDWAGGECPVPGDTLVNYASRDTDAMHGELGVACEAEVFRADELEWGFPKMCYSVRAYRVVSK